MATINVANAITLEFAHAAQTKKEGKPY